MGIGLATATVGHTKAGLVWVVTGVGTPVIFPGHVTEQDGVEHWYTLDSNHH